MIVVNIKQSVKRLVDDVRLGIPDDVILQQLKHVTTTKWAGLGRQMLDSLPRVAPSDEPSAESLYAHGDSSQEDYIAGVAGDQIVSIYLIRGWHRTEGRVVFDVVDVGGVQPQMAAAIGHPTPGGPWKQGEARPIRYIDTQVFQTELLDRDPATDDYEADDVERRMVEVIRALAGPPPAPPLLEGVNVERDPRGGIRVTVPIGTKVTIVQRGE